MSTAEAVWMSVELLLGQLVQATDGQPSVVKNATSGTSTAVLRAPTGRIVDTSCRASRSWIWR